MGKARGGVQIASFSFAPKEDKGKGEGGGDRVKINELSFRNRILLSLSLFMNTLSGEIILGS